MTITVVSLYTYRDRLAETLAKRKRGRLNNYHSSITAHMQSVITAHT